jgi:hypothetical protein
LRKPRGERQLGPLGQRADLVLDPRALLTEFQSHSHCLAIVARLGIGNPHLGQLSAGQHMGANFIQDHLGVLLVRLVLAAMR